MDLKKEEGGFAFPKGSHDHQRSKIAAATMSGALP